MKQRRHGHRPALADLVEPEAVRHVQVLEQHFVEAGLAGHLDERPDRDSLRVLDRHDEVGQPVVFVIAAGAQENDHPAREVSEARPYLVAVDHPLIALALGEGLRAREVRSRTRLAEALAPDLVGGEQRR